MFFLPFFFFIFFFFFFFRVRTFHIKFLALDLIVELGLDVGTELGGSVRLVQVLDKVRVDDQPGLLVLSGSVGFGADGFVGQAGVLGVHAALGLAGLHTKKRTERLVS